MRSEAAGAPLSAGVLGTTTDGLVEPAGVLHARTAPPREAARARASRIRFDMILGFLRCRGVGGSDTSRGLVVTTATDVSEDRGTTTRRSAPGSLQAPRILTAVRVRAGGGRLGVRAGFGRRAGSGKSGLSHTCNDRDTAPDSIHLPLRLVDRDARVADQRGPRHRPPGPAQTGTDRQPTTDRGLGAASPRQESHR